VSVRVSPTGKIRAEIDALFGGERELGEVIEDVARLGARLIIQTALEAEVDAFLGRARYQRSAAAEDARPGSRNGYSPATVKTTAGPVTIARPKLRGTAEAFASKLFGTTVTKSNALESLVIAGFVRGLSVRDVENTLADALGAEAALSKSTVSRVCQAIGGQFETWRTRPLDGVLLDYLFLDASMFKMHPGARAEPVLAAWGIDTEGKPVFVALAPGGSESTDAWGEFLDELRGRGLRPPLLVISDGAAGLISAIESSLPRSLRQKCLIHRSRKESTCRRVMAGWRRSEEIGRCAVAAWCVAWNVAFLLEERPGLPDDVADRGSADIAEGVSEDVQGAKSFLVEDGEQDAFAVTDLLGEDATPGSGLAWAAAPLVAEAFGLGSLPGCEPLAKTVQFVAGESGQGRVGQPVDDLGPCGAQIAVEEGEQGIRGSEADRCHSGVVAVIFEDFTGLLDKVAYAGGGHFQEIGQHVHGADLPLIEQREQEPRGIVEQWFGAGIASGPPGAAAALLAVSLLSPRGLGRGEPGGQLLQLCGAHAGQPRVAQPAEHGLAAPGGTARLAGGCRLAAGRLPGIEGVVPGAMGGVPFKRQGGEALFADRDTGGVVTGI
jgi:hypothetical protein